MPTTSRNGHLRVAFVGKGGVGKSAIAGTFARLLARAGQSVLALDSDPMPGLAYSLGLERSDAGIPDDAVEERREGEKGPRFRLRAGLGAAEAVERYTTLAPDGVRFLQFGKLQGHVGPLVRSQHAFRQIVEELPPDRWSVIGDLPGGPRQPFFGWAAFAHTVLIVTEPTPKSIFLARRLVRMAELAEMPQKLAVLVNKVRDPDDPDNVARRTGLDLAGAIPWDEDFAEAERKGLAPLDHVPNCPAVRAVESLLDRLAKEALTI